MIQGVRVTTCSVTRFENDERGKFVCYPGFYLTAGDGVLTQVGGAYTEESVSAAFMQLIIDQREHYERWRHSI